MSEKKLEPLNCMQSFSSEDKISWREQGSPASKWKNLPYISLIYLKKRLIVKKILHFQYQFFKVASYALDAHETETNFKQQVRE